MGILKNFFNFSNTLKQKPDINFLAGLIPKINGSGGAYLVFKKTNQMKINVLFGDVFIELQSASKQREHLAKARCFQWCPVS